MMWKEPRVLGFFKESEGPEIIVAELKGEPGDLYVEIPSGFRNRMEIVVGNKIRCFLEATLDRNGNKLKEINREMIGEIVGYWNELHLPEEEIFENGLKKGDLLRLHLLSVFQFGEERKV
ncbi:MAG: hypothetical protein NZ583_05585 [Desulfobacterota bacterium]|nr:hypothetical protein [Thermodesulfobacteriota bacterium]MDW8002679.1 hypothetical protein [Deltaproteobacteria bacterium]